MLTRAILVAILLSTTAHADVPCVALRITSWSGREVHIAHGPVNLTAEVRVQQRDEHRYVIVAWDYAPDDVFEMRSTFSDNYVHDSSAFMNDEQPFDAEQRDGSIGSEERSLNGAEQSVRNDFKLHNLEGGTFLVTATVYTDESRKHACGRATARVIVR